MLNNNSIKTFEEVKSETGSYGSLMFDYLVVKNALLNSNLINDLNLENTNDQNMTPMIYYMQLEVNYKRKNCWGIIFLYTFEGYWKSRCIFDISCFMT